MVARMAERWYTRLSKVLSVGLSGRQPLVLYASHPEFEQTNVIEGQIDEGTGGVTEGLQRRDRAAARREPRQRPTTCSATSSCTRFSTTSSAQEAGAMPLWFIEGMAEYLSLGPRDTQTAMWLRDAAREDRLPSITDLDNPRYSRTGSATRSGPTSRDDGATR